MKITYALMFTLIGLTTVSAHAMEPAACAYQYTAGSIENVRNTVGFNSGKQIELLYKSAEDVCLSGASIAEFLMNRSSVRKSVDQAIADALKPTRAN